MKRLTHCLTLVLFLGLTFCMTGGAWAQQEDIQNHPSCPFCGMDREKFAHSRVLVAYDDDSESGACSLHCAALDMAVNMNKAPQAIKVGDYNTKELIDAESATWVIVPDSPGVMTRRAKWAFKDKAGAEKFIQEKGGNPVTFEEALKATYEDMYEDTRMIREKRKQMHMKDKGQHSQHDHG